MPNSIISNEVEETKGIDLSNIEENIDNASNEEEQLEISSEQKHTDAVITEEMYNDSIEKIQTLNFIEVSKYIRQISAEIESHKITKENAEGILKLQESLKESNELSTAIELADAETVFINDDVNKFLENYDDTVAKLNKIREAAEEKLHTYDDVKKTTSFITGEMLAIIDKNIERINSTVTEENESKTKRLLQYYTNIKNAYANRNDISWVIDKVDSQQIVMRRLKNSMKKDKTNATLSSTQKNVTKAFCKVFNVNQLIEFEKYLRKLFNNDDAAFYTQYLLYLLYTSEKKYGKYGNHKHVEMLIMNVLEIISDNYDLEGGKEQIDSQLLKLRDKIITSLNLK